MVSQWTLTRWYGLHTLHPYTSYPRGRNARGLALMQEWIRHQLRGICTNCWQGSWQQPKWVYIIGSLAATNDIAHRMDLIPQVTNLGAVREHRNVPVYNIPGPSV